MATRAETRRIRLAEWKKIFEDRARTGLSIKDYCIANNISRDSYFYWQNLARIEALNQAACTLPKVVEIKSPATSNSMATVHETCILDSGASQSATVLSINYHGANIQVTSDTPRELLTMVLEVMSDVE